jgi:exopolyphosphatase/guanosine-5'-triphosphate,3'-diphosphate pyrophosphatase
VAARRRQQAVPLSVGSAIDIGSNSVHLLVGLVGDGWLEPLRDTSELLGLGDVVDRDGAIPPATRRRLVEVLGGYLDTAHRSQSEHVTVLGTEPLRRARNAEELAAEIYEATGVPLHVLSEQTEALLTFIGVTRGQLPDSPLIVVDIGGGSSEVAAWFPGTALQTQSIPVGSARLTQSIAEHDPPTPKEMELLQRAAAEAVRDLALPAIPLGDVSAARAIFVGGTATNVARLGRLDLDDLARDRKTLGRIPSNKVTSRYNVKPRRARQLAAGVAIVEAVLRRYGLEAAAVSEASLRDGAIIAHARFGDEWPDRIDEFLTPVPVRA